MRKYIYQCDTCGRTLSMPDNPKKSIEHLNVKTVNIFFSYYSKKEKRWCQARIDWAGSEHHFCNGKCQGIYIDQKVEEITKQLKNQ